MSRRLILQQARGQRSHSPPTAWELTVSCSISLPNGGFFSLFLMLLLRYRSPRCILPGKVILVDSLLILHAPFYSGLSVSDAFGYWALAIYVQYSTASPGSTKLILLSHITIFMI